jgi:hypothetical protein
VERKQKAKQWQELNVAINALIVTQAVIPLVKSTKQKKRLHTENLTAQNGKLKSITGINGERHFTVLTERRR